MGPAPPEDDFYPRDSEPRGSLTYPGSELLAGKNSKAILRTVFEGDPLGLTLRCRQRLEDRWVLLDHQQIVLRTMAWVAELAPAYRGDPPLDQWLEQRIDDAIEDLLIEDAETERSGELPTEPFETRFRLLSMYLGVEITLTRRVCLIVNDLTPELRHAFYAMIVQGKSPERHAVEIEQPKERVLAWLKRALLAVSKLEWDSGEGSAP